MPAFNNSFAQLHSSFYSRVESCALTHPSWVVKNDALARQLGIDFSGAAASQFLHAFSGAKPLPGSAPLAMAYAGHQFGHYVAQLGDGRGMLLGEINTADGKWDLHLKGAGRTPYSRGGDGRAVLRSTLREYIASEALHGLGVPTTRALCVTTGSNTVWRESLEPAAMLVRVARSHVRFGSFEFFHYSGQVERVRELADYCIAQYFPAAAAEPGDDARYRLFFQSVVERTAAMIASWQCLGFAHGVMNTDNMSIVGDTFDFGPYGFIDRYDANYVCNHSDHDGRYAFNAQPGIGLWNLTALAQALSSLLTQETLQQVLATYEPTLVRHYSQTMLRKLGLQSRRDGDQQLVQELLGLMQTNGADFTLTFRELAEVDSQTGAATKVAERFLLTDGFAQWLDAYRRRLRDNSLDNSLGNAPDEDARRALMNNSNPLYIARNHLAQIAIEHAENGDYSELHRLLAVLSKPYQQQHGRQNYADPAPAWSEALEISCSS